MFQNEYKLINLLLFDTGSIGSGHPGRGTGGSGTATAAGRAAYSEHTA